MEKGLFTVGFLIISNIFMTLAWYGHLKMEELGWLKKAGIFTIILISWCLAFFEYCFQVPANRIGHYNFSAAQLKIIQEVITLVVFAVFSIFYLREGLRWNYIVAFMMIIGAVFFMFKEW